jgi:CRISPR-associated protein Cmr1
MLSPHEDYDVGEIGMPSVTSYALWPARGDKTGAPPARRRQPGAQFEVTLVMAKRREREVLDAARAWILFGGYGGRARRGLGTLRLRNGALVIPKHASKDEVERAFGHDVFALGTPFFNDTPCLAGARLLVGAEVQDAAKAWETALKWLSDFRQGSSGKKGDRAREPGTDKNQPSRPSISNWPEPDKIRHLTGKIGSHKPRHNAIPTWPRAGFGLPILGRFQSKDRDGGYFANEPRQFDLRWEEDGIGVHDRLASPLIVKPLALSGGGFVPCALWLNRANPPGQVVCAEKVTGGKLVAKANSAAPFDRLVSEGDVPRFSALADKASLRDAFCDWLVKNGVTEITK